MNKYRIKLLSSLKARTSNEMGAFSLRIVNKNVERHHRLTVRAWPAAREKSAVAAASITSGQELNRTCVHAGHHKIRIRQRSMTHWLIF